MTPTLFGRWQTRTFLLLVVGGIVTLIYWGLLRQVGVIASDNYTFFVVLIVLTLIGYIWDILYHEITKLRWDQDWPAVYQFLAGIWEYIVIWAILSTGVIPFTVSAPGTGWLFHTHYWIVFLITYFVSQSLLRLLDPRWRFRGGQFGSY